MPWDAESAGQRRGKGLTTRRLNFRLPSCSMKKLNHKERWK